jgi:hypothetical protein
MRWPLSARCGSCSTAGRAADPDTRAARRSACDRVVALGVGGWPVAIVTPNTIVAPSCNAAATP